VAHSRTGTLTVPSRRIRFQKNPTVTEVFHYKQPDSGYNPYREMCAPAANPAVPDTGQKCQISRSNTISKIPPVKGSCGSTLIITRQLQKFNRETFNYRIGSTVYKKSKYSMSSNHMIDVQTNGRNRTYPAPTIAQGTQSTKREDTKNWTKCVREVFKTRSRRLINVINPIQNHKLLAVPKARPWAPSIPVYHPRLFNYYQPLSQYTHGKEAIMEKDKTKEAEITRANMTKLRTGGQPPPKQPFHNGGRGVSRPIRGTGRGGGGRGRSPTPSQTKITALFAKKASETVSISSSEASTTPSVLKTTSETTEHTKQTSSSRSIQPTALNTTTTECMEEDEVEAEEDDGLKPTSITSVPQTIPAFTPNKQWIKDVESRLPKTRYGIEIKIEPQQPVKAGSEPPAYHHIRIFKGIASAIMTAAPTTVICSIDDTEEAFDDVDDIPTSKASVEKYLETPIVNTKTHTYHARIYISCIKPLFILMKNEALMQWLTKNKIFLEENDLDTVLPTNVGLIFFIHTRAALNKIHNQQLRSFLQGQHIPTFKIKPWKARSQQYEGRVYVIQSIKEDVETINRKFENSRNANPYEYISWKSWTDLNADKKASLIDQHNNYTKEYRLLTLSGFTDNNDIMLGQIDREPEENDYSKMGLNEFLMKHYTIGDPPCQIIAQVLGPTNGTRQFIVSSYLEKVAKDLLQNLQYDMLSYMTEESGRAIIPNYEDKVMEAAENPIWEPNWFEEHIVPISQPTPAMENRATKRQKANPPKTYTNTITKNEAKQSTNDALTFCTSSSSIIAEAKIATLEKLVAELQTQQVDLLDYIQGVKQTQRDIQNELITVNNHIETVERSTQLVTRDIKTCQLNVTRIETGLATLTTKQETTELFSQILMMFGEVNASLQQITAGNNHIQGHTMPTQEQNDVAMGNNMNPNHKQLMQDHENTQTISKAGSGDHTNSQQQQLANYQPVK
jgi:hypothetical protein